MKLLVFALLPAVALCQMLAGGISETTVNKTDEPVLFAIEKTNSFLTSHLLTSSPVDLDDVEVLHARTQVVAGQNLFLTLQMGAYICEVTVWYRAWLDNQERLQMTHGPDCSKAGARRQLGAPSDSHQYDSAPAEVVNAMQFAVCAVNDRSNAMNYAVVQDTSTVTYTQQVTAGMTYVFSNVVLQESDCRKDSDACAFSTLQSCSPKDHGGMTMTCTLEVQWQAWMDPAYTLSNMNCNNH